MTCERCGRPITGALPWCDKPVCWACVTIHDISVNAFARTKRHEWTSADDAAFRDYCKGMKP